LVEETRENHRPHKNKLLLYFYYVVNVYLCLELLFFFFKFQTAYEEGHTEAVIRLVEKNGYDVNYVMPSSGLSLFLVC
jgi:hypothetical protein